MPPSRRNQRALVPRRVLREILDDTRPGMYMTRQAREMLQAEGEQYLFRLFQRLAIMAAYSGNTTVLLHHLRALQAMDHVQNSFDGTRD